MPTKRKSRMIGTTVEDDEDAPSLVRAKPSFVVRLTGVNEDDKVDPSVFVDIDWYKASQVFGILKHEGGEEVSEEDDDKVDDYVKVVIPTKMFLSQLELLKRIAESDAIASVNEEDRKRTIKTVMPCTITYHVDVVKHLFRKATLFFDRVKILCFDELEEVIGSYMLRYALMEEGVVDASRTHESQALLRRYPWLRTRYRDQRRMITILSWVFEQEPMILGYIPKILPRPTVAIIDDRGPVCNMLGLRPQNEFFELTNQMYLKDVIVDADVIGAASTESYVVLDKHLSLVIVHNQKSFKAASLGSPGTRLRIIAGCVIKYSLCKQWVYIAFRAQDVVVCKVVCLSSFTTFEVTQARIFNSYTMFPHESAAAFNDFVSSKVCDVDDQRLVVCVNNQMIFVQHKGLNTKTRVATFEPTTQILSVVLDDKSWCVLRTQAGNQLWSVGRDGIQTLENNPSLGSEYVPRICQISLTPDKTKLVLLSNATGSGTMTNPWFRVWVKRLGGRTTPATSSTIPFTEPRIRNLLCVTNSSIYVCADATIRMGFSHQQAQGPQAQHRPQRQACEQPSQRNPIGQRHEQQDAQRADGKADAV